MQTLTIKDLSRTEQLERSEMAAVRGGWSMFAPPYQGDLNYVPRHDASITAAQNLFQQQEVATLTANGSAFVHGVHVDNEVRQDGQNKIVG